MNRARTGDSVAMDQLIERYRGFVRMKASAYFLAGGEGEDLVQEGLIGLFKAVRDYRSDREASFRSFAELCVTRQIITAIKTAARNKHAPLNTYVSFSHTRAGASGDQEMTPRRGAARATRSSTRSRRSSRPRSCAAWSSASASRSPSSRASVLTMYLEGRSYEEIAERLDRTPKTVDNALQRVKRKVLAHLRGREVLDLR